MKAKNILVLIFLVALMSCSTKTKNPLEGTWNLVHFKWTFPDSSFLEYPGNVRECSGKWMILDNRSLWYFRYKSSNDSIYKFEFGDMKYSFDGKIYQETYLSCQDDKLIGQTFHYYLSIAHDTLTLSGPLEGDIEKLGCVVLEQFIRE
jgi:hypothetical protein